MKDEVEKWWWYKLTGLNKQKGYFDNLSEVIDTPIYTARNWREKNNFRPGNQRIIGGWLPPIDHRSIGSNEVVIELDAKSYSLNAKYAQDIKEYLDSQEIPHYCFWSGNKSIHIHIFLEIDLKQKEIQELVRDAYKKGCNLYKFLRLKLTREIVEQSGLNPALIGMGNVVDLAKLSWDDLAGKQSLIRCCGGANKKIDGAGKIRTAYKTFFEKIPPKKPVNQFTNIDEVVFPDTLKKYDVGESFVAGIAKEFLDTISKTKSSFEAENIAFKGTYMKLPCIQTLLEGSIPGSRSFASQQISIASRLDGNNLEQTKKLIGVFVDNCSQVPEPFDIKEGEKWVDWVYRLPTPYFACGLSKRLKACQKADCKYHKEKYAEHLKVFDVDDPLSIIKEMLDIFIKGEDNLKIQLFLLYLTKAFNPEWCIVLDGAASSGKSHVMKAVAKLFGEEDEDYFVYSRLTGAVLNRLEDEVNKWEDSLVLIEEFQGAKAALEQLRVLISERKLTLLETVEKTKPDGTKELVASNKTIQVKNTLFVTCQAEDEDEGNQFKSRAWILNTDTSNDQSKEVVKYYLDEFEGIKGHVDDELLDRIRTALKLLETPDKVVFPWSKELIDYLPTRNVRVRRDIKKLISLIKASAYFHQKNRTWFVHKDTKERILCADWRDVDIVLKYAWSAIMATAQGLGEKDLGNYYVIESNLIYVPEFTVDDIQRWCKIGLAEAKKLIANLCKEGYFENITKPPEKGRYVKTAISPSFTKPNSSNSYWTVPRMNELKDYVKKRELNSSKNLKT